MVNSARYDVSSLLVRIQSLFVACVSRKLGLGPALTLGNYDCELMWFYVAIYHFVASAWARGVGWLVKVSVERMKHEIVGQHKILKNTSEQTFGKITSLAPA
ncbi:unnamed protein product [Cercospora beticola]|nr:unnamed protein product [Cercospora beticola]